MKRTPLVTVVAAIICVGSASAAEVQGVAEISPDLLKPQLSLKSELQEKVPLVLAPEILAAAAAAPSQADVGDADSFGRPVIYLGLAQTLPVEVLDDCSAADPALERCIVAQPAPLATSFNETNLASISLPAKASKSLLCFALTPFVQVYWQNNTGTRQVARFNALADITLENPMFADPALINPTTGMPFGGSLTTALSTWVDTHSIEDGAFSQERSTQSRACVGGVISKRSLIETYGFTAAQASQFFRQPMTLRFAARGQVSMTQLMTYFYGIRLYGD